MTASDIAPSRNAPIDRGAAALGLGVAVLANLRYLAGVGELVDPLVSMEPFYIRMAQQPVGDILREPAAWGPLYALWLKPLVALLADPLAVVAANLWCLSLALTVAIYLHLLLLTRRAAMALPAALLFLVSDANVPLAGKVSGFALLVLLLGWTLAGLTHDRAQRGALAAAAVLLAAYARPELYPAALVLVGLALWQALRQRHRGAGVLLWPTTVLALTVGLASAVGVPVRGVPPRGDRLFDAFREHFAWNWGTWNGEWRYFHAVWQQEFGDAGSLLEAVGANPAAFAHHLASNLVGSLGFLLGGAFRHVPLLAPLDSAAGVGIEAWLVGIAVFGALAVVVARPALRRRIRARYGDALLCYAVVAAPCLAAATLVYPRQHYLLIPGILALLAGTLAAATILPPPAARGWPLRLLAAAACLAIVPRPFVLPSAYAVPGAPYSARVAVDRPVTDTVAFVRTLALPRPLRVLTLSDGLGDLLGPGFEEVRMWQKGDQPLADYLREQRVDVIVAMTLEHDSFVVQDDHWLLIQTDPAAAGFSRLAVPGHGEVGLFVRAGLP
jgi:hypothetical protein